MTRRHLCGVDIDCEDISSAQAGCPAQAISTIYAQSISKYLLCIVVPFPGREHNADTAPPFLCSTHPATNTTQCWKYVLLFRTADEERIAKAILSMGGINLGVIKGFES